VKKSNKKKERVEKITTTTTTIRRTIFTMITISYGESHRVDVPDAAHHVFQHGKLLPRRGKQALKLDEVPEFGKLLEVIPVREREPVLHGRCERGDERRECLREHDIAAGLIGAVSNEMEMEMAEKGGADGRPRY
jgi:hypothetical protein